MNRQNLRLLNLVRALVLCGQSFALWWFSHVDDIGLAVYPIVFALLVIAVVTAFSAWRCRWVWPVSHVEFFCHLLFDVCALSWLLYLSGGAANPFVSYFLVPISIAAATLPGYLTWVVALISVLAYSLLTVWNVPVPMLMPHHAGHDARLPNLHLAGMWWNFAFSAVLIAVFVARMAAALRRQEAEIARQREAQLQDQQLLAVATLAAGTAHELGTPLNTLRVLADEMRATVVDQPALQADLELMQQQVEECKRTLGRLKETAEFGVGDEAQPVAAADYLARLFERWQLLRPRVRAGMRLEAGLHEATLSVHPSIGQALLNLLNNAADASPDHVELLASRDGAWLKIDIVDRGPGIDEVRAGRSLPAPSPGGSGLGIGLFLSRASIERRGGRLEFRAARPAGTVATVRLPLPEPEGV